MYVYIFWFFSFAEVVSSQTTPFCALINLNSGFSGELEPVVLLVFLLIMDKMPLDDIAHLRQFLAVNKLEQSYDHISMLVKKK